VSSFVLDASVACAWLFADEQTPALLALLGQAGDDTVYVPALWRTEVLNTLVQASRRGRIGADQVVQCWEQLEKLLIRVASYEPEADRIVGLCAKHGLTAYDACYLDLALHMQLPLATLDADLARAAAAEGVAVLGR